MFTQNKICSLITSISTIVFLCSPVHAWIEPTTIPPGNNIYAPLNSSSFGQSKIGGLILNIGQAAHGLIVRYGLVGIGTDNPESKLDVRGETKTDSLTVRGNATVNGSVSAVGNIATNNSLCINGDCKSAWPVVAPSSNDTLQTVTSRGNTTDREMVKNNDYGMWFGGTHTGDRVRVGELWGQGGVFAGSGKDLLLGSDSGWVRVNQNFSTAGNVGIGTNGPISKLDVRGKALFTRDGVGECCGNDATVMIGENTASTGKRSSISFHNGGRHEGTFELAPDGERRFRMYDNQGARMGLETTGTVIAPNLRDLDNGGYYLDPNGSSNLNAVHGDYFHTARNDSWFPYPGNNYNYLRGHTIFNGVLYDENNTGYYLDPAGSSKVNQMTANSLCLGGDCRPNWNVPRRHCFWIRLETHWMASCPNGYHVDGMGLTNASAGCWEPGCQGGQSDWVTAGGFRCCND